MDQKSKWRDDAACNGKATRYYDPWDTPDHMFEPLPDARKICERCSVRVECLADALEMNDACVRGGLTKRQRDAIQRPRRRKTCPVCAGHQFTIIPETSIQVCTPCGQSWPTKRQLVSLDSLESIDLAMQVVDIRKRLSRDWWMTRGTRYPVGHQHHKLCQS